MASSYTIRRAEHTDISSLIELLRILFSIEADFSVDESKQRIGLEMMLHDKTRCCIMVAEINEKVVGMCSAQLLISTAEGGVVPLIEDLVVNDEHRGKGIGKSLLSSVESWATEKEAKRLELLADRNNTSAFGILPKNELEVHPANLLPEK